MFAHLELRKLTLLVVLLAVLLLARIPRGSHMVHAGLPVLSAGTTASGGGTTRVSVNSEGDQADGFSSYPTISADGSLLTFDSFASNLVSEDTNGKMDIFVHEVQTGATLRVSVNSTGEQANGDSVEPDMAASGRFVAFMSFADNLATGDDNNEFDIFVRDLQTQKTELVSLNSSGEQANDYCAAPVVSADGRYVAFMSPASNLTPGDSNEVFDIFVRDRQSKTTERISVGKGGLQANNHSSLPGISENGRFVAFLSIADNLVPGDTNGKADIFVHDMQTNRTQRVSISSEGKQANDVSLEPNISGDGRFVVFSSSASNLVPGDSNGKQDIFIRDRENGLTERVSLGSDAGQGNDDSSEPAVSVDGRFVTFTSLAGNLVSEDTNDVQDIFLYDRQSGKTERLSIDSSGEQADGGSFISDITAEGGMVTFLSFAANLTPGDTNGEADIFIRDRFPGRTSLFLPFIKGK